MDSIDYGVMAVVAHKVDRARFDHPDVVFHTVTVSLNGGHGGADVTIEGTNAENESVTLERTVYR